MAQSFVVLGAYGGVGEALCRRLASRGARLLVAGRDAQKLARLASEVDGEAFTLDATQPEQVEACLCHAADVFGRLDGVANCVGSFLIKPAHAIAAQEWNAMMAPIWGQPSRWYARQGS